MLCITLANEQFWSFTAKNNGYNPFVMGTGQGKKKNNIEI